MDNDHWILYYTAFVQPANCVYVSLYRSTCYIYTHDLYNLKQSISWVSKYTKAINENVMYMWPSQRKPALFTQACVLEKKF